MIEIDINSLRDNRALEEVDAQIAIASDRLAAARAAHAAAVDAYASAVASARQAVVHAAAGADIDAEARGAAVTAALGQIGFRADLAAACEAALDTAKAKRPGAMHTANVPVAERGWDLRLAASVAADRARADLAEADAVFQQGTRLIVQAHAGGLFGTPPAPTASAAITRPARDGANDTQPPRNAVWTEADERKLKEPRHEG